MKYLIQILFIILPYISVGQSWLWAKHLGSSSIDRVNKICTDSNGDIYIFGEFGYYFSIPNYMLIDGDTVWNSGVNQLYLAKISNLGNVIWTKSIGGDNVYQGSCNNCESAYDMTIDTINNALYVSGKLYGTGNFGDTILSGNGTMFISKFDLDGNYFWTKSMGGSSIVSAGLTIDNSGFCYLIAYTTDTIYIDNLQILPGKFWTKMDNLGSLQWVQKIDINAQSYERFVFNNNVFTFFWTINDTTQIDTFLYISNSNYNLLFTNFDSLGNLKWFRGINSSANINAKMVKDEFSNFYISGTFQNDIRFDTISFYTPNYDLFIAKYDSNGNFIWAKQGHSSIRAGFGILASSKEGFVYVLGSFNGNLTLDGYNLNSANDQCFLACFETNGNCIGVEQIPYVSGSASIAVDKIGNCLLSSEFNLNYTIGANSFSAYGANDLFLAKHDVITGTQEVTKKSGNQLIIYANPNQGKCNITVPEEFLNERLLVLSIYDNTGKLIQQKQLEMIEGKIKVNLEAEAKGIYNVTLSSKLKNYFGKIVFE